MKTSHKLIVLGLVGAVITIFYVSLRMLISGFIDARPAHLISYIFSIALQYVLIRFTAFRVLSKRGSNEAKRVFRFIIQVLVISVLTTLVQPYLVGDELLRSISSIVIITLFNLLFYFRWTFKN